MKTWKQKIGKRLLQHVSETTSNITLREVKRNLEVQRASGDFCFQCEDIARRLGLPALVIEEPKKSES